MSEFALWEYDREVEMNGHSAQMWSPRIRGEYKLSIDTVRYLDLQKKTRGTREFERLKAKLATYLLRQIANGDDSPVITSELITQVAEHHSSLPVPQSARGLLLFMTTTGLAPHESINLTSDGPSIEAALGASESIDEDELGFYLNYLVDAELITDTTGKNGGYFVTVRGYETVEQERQATDSSEVFVAMWFDDETDSLWEALDRGISAAGYTAIRIDREPHSNLIDDEIVAHIRRCRFVVCDLTHGDTGHRGSVYYEAGFARGLEKEVIQTVRCDILEDGSIAFDLDHYPTISWKEDELEPFERDLRYRIESIFGKGPNDER